MATFYQGYKHVIKGRDADESVHHWKGTAGTYSNWELMNSSHPLDGAPNNHTVVGAERLTSPTLLELLYSGAHHIYPIRNAGEGVRLEGARFRPYTYRGLDGSKAFGSSFGHADRTTSYSLHSNYAYYGVDSTKQMDDPGHALRYDSAYGGASKPHIHQGLTKAIASTFGQGIPEGYDNEYGHNKVNEWIGVPSARAL